MLEEATTYEYSWLVNEKLEKIYEDLNPGITSINRDRVCLNQSSLLLVGTSLTITPGKFNIKI
jgi:hypothetical protein